MECQTQFFSFNIFLTDTVNSSEHVAQSMLTGANRCLRDKGGEAEGEEIFGQVRLGNTG